MLRRVAELVALNARQNPFVADEDRKLAVVVPVVVIDRLPVPVIAPTPSVPSVVAPATASVPGVTYRLVRHVLSIQSVAVPNELPLKNLTPPRITRITNAITPEYFVMKFMSL